MCYRRKPVGEMREKWTLTHVHQHLSQVDLKKAGLTSFISIINKLY